MSTGIELGNIYKNYQAGNFVQSEIQIRKLIETDGTNSDVLRLGALTALALNQVTMANERLNKALQHHPITAETANTLGNILKASGDWSDSEEAYRHAMNLNPNYVPVRANLVDMLVQSGQADRAISEISKQIQQYGENDLLILAKANALINMGSYIEAQKAISTIKNPEKLLHVNSLQIRLYFHLRDYRNMKKIWDNMSVSSLHAPVALGIIANAYAMQGDWEKFHAVIDHACNHTNSQPEIFIKSSRLLNRIGKSNMAVNLLTKALKHYGDEPNILSELSSYALDENDFSKAYTLSREALSLSPGKFSIMLNAAQAAMASGHYEFCQHLIQSALMQAPNNQYLYALAASLKRKCGGEYKTLYNYNNFIRVYEIEAPSGYKNIIEFNKVLKHSLEAQHDFKSAPLNQSLRGGTQTDTNLYFVDDPVIQSFFTSLDKPIKDYMSKIGNDRYHPFTCRNTNNYRINGAWSVRLLPNGHHVNHVHPMGWISSSYYVDVPNIINKSDKHEGWIKFGESGIKGVELPAEKFIQPKPGRLVLFPSYMWHGTVPFSGDETRLTLPFDVLPA